MTIHESYDQKQQNIAVKEWLWRYRRAKLDVRRLEGEYEELVSIQESAGAVAYDGMPHASGNNPDLSGLMIIRDSALSKLIRAKQKATNAYTEILTAFDELEDIEKDIMSYRYIQLKEGYGVYSMDEIADIIKYTPSYVKKIHGIALQKLAPIIFRIEKEDTKSNLK